MYKVYLYDYRSVATQEFEVGPFTVLFGKNNAGKTNLLEAIYGVLAERVPGGEEGRFRSVDPRGGGIVGAVFVQLEPGHEFDDHVLSQFPEWEPVHSGVIRFSELPPGCVCYTPGIDRDDPELWFVDAQEFLERSDGAAEVPMPQINEDDEPGVYEIDEQSRLSHGPRPHPLFLGGEFENVDRWVTSVMPGLTGRKIPNHFSVGDWIRTTKKCLEPVDGDESAGAWRVSTAIRDRTDQLAVLATDLLPDFLDGSIHVNVDLPTYLGDSLNVRVRYEGRDEGEPRSVEDFGRGAARWLSIAVQVALHIMDDDRQIMSVGVAGPKQFSGQMLFLDEPEAHLHPSAVASVVRWCQRMVKCGFNVVTASHHEEFLRASGATFVKVSREIRTVDSSTPGHPSGMSPWQPSVGTTRSVTKARTVPIAATSVLHELADEVGMHPAAALSLHRAVLFVEGSLDEAVLDEYAGPAFDAAGVTIIPIHGTKNLEGLIDGEFTTRLGIKVGVLTDNTLTDTIWDRSNRKRSSEEIKLVRLIKRFEEQGLMPPDIFGVAEDDLLFALPEQAIREYLNGPFPGWQELRDECRAAEGRGPSESVDWKSYAETHYGLPITTAGGVRTIIRALDLAGIELPSIRAVVDDIIAWAKGQ